MANPYTIKAETVSTYVKEMAELCHKTDLTKQEAIDMIEMLYNGWFSDEGFEDIDRYFEPVHEQTKA